MLETAPVTHFHLEKGEQTKIKPAHKCLSVNSETFLPLKGVSCFVFELRQRVPESIYGCGCPLEQGCWEAERGVLSAGQSSFLYASFVGLLFGGADLVTQTHGFARALLVVSELDKVLC